MKNRLLKKAMSIVLAASLVLHGGIPLGGLLASGAQEQIKLDISKGNITIEGNTATNGSDQITALTSNPVFHITQSTADTANTITVKSGAVNITIENININIENIDASGTSAFSIENDASVNLTLKGTNKLKSPLYKAGLQVPETASLTITEESGSHSLEAKGGMSSAGIGGSYGSSSGRITICGGSITAAGGSPGGSGIGGGQNGGDSTVIIYGGSITAAGAGGGAGIGGGGSDSGAGGNGTVTIYGGSINATSAINGAGIGGGNGVCGKAGAGAGAGGNGTVTIYGGTITAFFDTDVNGIGIGGGNGGDGDMGGSGGMGGSGSIIINGGSITTNGAIGGGRGGTGGRGEITSGGDGGSGGSGSITISGGSITTNDAIGGGRGGTGGRGEITSGGDGGNGGNSSITINGGSITANGVIGESVGGTGGASKGVPNGVDGLQGTSDIGIIGGTIKGTIQGNLNDGKNIPVYPTTVTLTDANNSPVKGTEIRSITTDPLFYYGIKDVKTDNDGKLYLYLPDNTAVTEIGTSANAFVGDVQSGSTGTLTDLKVTGVTPSGINNLINGDLTIAFNKTMDTVPGTVSLVDIDNTAVTLDTAKGSWKDDKTYIIPYTGLNYANTYTVHISGFKDNNKTPVKSDSTHSFTTEPDPAVPSVSDDTMTIPNGITTYFHVSFGQGSKAATKAWIQSDDNSIITIRKFIIATPSQAQTATPSTAAPSTATPSTAGKATPSQAGTEQLELTSPGPVMVTGKGTGTANLTITFNDGEQTTRTIQVTVLPPAPTWPSGSSLTASGITDTEATLTWTEATDDTGISGYMIFQDGAFIGLTDASVSSYTAEGLSPSTNYHFQVEAGNNEDIWTADGPTLEVTTRASDYTDSDDSDSDDSDYGGLTFDRNSGNTTAPVIEASTLSSILNPNGQASTSVSWQTMDELIASAIEKARSQGKAADHIGVSLNIEAPAGTTGLSVTLPQSVTELLAQAGTEQLEIHSGLFSLAFDRESLKEIQKQVTGDLTLSITPAGRPSGGAGAMTGQRPVFHVTLSYVREGKTEFITSLGDGRALLSIPYTPADGEEPGYLYAVYVDDNGSGTRIPDSVYDANTKSVLFTTDHFSIYGIGYTEPVNTFTDIASHWAKDYIEYVTDRGFLKGAAETAFEPDAPMTLGEMKTSLDALSGTDTGSLIAAAGESPDQTVTRQEAAALFMDFTRSLGQTFPAARKAAAFQDYSKIDRSNRAAVSTLQQAGIITAMADNRFRPEKMLTKAQFSAMVYRYASRMIAPSTAQGFDINDSGQRMYYQEGRAVTGWVPADADGSIRYYYFDSSAVMAAGKWVKINGKWYYFYADGSLAVSTTIDGYRVDEDGVMQDS